MILVFFLLLFPILFISKWNVPSADDYTYGINVHNTVINGGSFFDVLKSAAKTAKDTYNNWQGTASAVFLFALMPASFGEQYYAIVPWLMVISLVSGVFILISQLCGLMKINKTYGWILSIIILIGSTQFQPSQVQSFYWYNGSVFYTFYFGISLIFYALLIKIGYDKNTFFTQITVCFLGAFIALSNYITALTTAIILISILVLFLIMRNKNWKRYVFPVLFYSAAFYLSISAPGNLIRKSQGRASDDAVTAIIHSFVYAFTQIRVWNRLPILALYLLICPVGWTIASETKYDYKLPWLISIYSFCLFSAMNCPTYYAFANPGPQRAENIRYFAMIILFSINICYWIGWVKKRIKRFENINTMRISIGYLLCVIVIFVYGCTKIPSYRITSYSAAQAYLLGWVGQYKHVYNQRIEILENPEIQDAVLREYPHNKPFVLYFSDISEDPNNWQNIAMSSFYNKNSVRRRHPDEPLPGIFDGD
ncbi:MAG: hypothetical protein IJI41_00815 [Anaerolineaceae bacterium]|nr:hypothetical protein [Anaerolineaceae bacterium]